MTYNVVQHRDGVKRVWVKGLDNRRNADRLARELNDLSKMLYGKGGPTYQVEEVAGVRA